MNRLKVGIVGATGYGGVELIRLLSNHPHFHIYSVYSSSQQHVQMVDVYPHLANVPYTLEQIDPVKMAKDVDLVFTATPSGISSKLVPQLINEGLKVIDLSGDFRLKSEELYEKWYKKPPAPNQYTKQSVYGLTEWFGEEIHSSSFIANPGCYPTATLLGLAPIVKKKLIKEDSIIIDAKSGLSGAGRSLSNVSHYAEINENMKIYKVNQHQHIPEIEQVLHRWNEQIKPITFSTHLVPMTRGIMTTIYVTLKESIGIESLYKLYEESYLDAPFVRVRKQGTFPSTKEVSGSNYCDIGLTIDERTNRMTIVSVIDNLVKGAAGQAIQNANLMMGFEQQTGLHVLPVYP
ncbi:N-acetyl-gamma-glutamyl-phosphate reductase [Metabacillus iocasae]|uniref:N-acetyl-gamma-glutamyl-phosphate reductase n=1 Tax=Priestia iocasae TaxID=2291674 RepID=A0ABS2QTS5_9BACI|nr:N-acetyl-gamma-glutamyl-phosphate reductase [Metabacillus iocasae]MBM7702603.1 N-acetyl-gamma-glutamyl-phosphate reductase [Metabacillus iocasae]